MVTLNQYLTEKLIDNVNFVKVDIEGAEMMFLAGAEKLFQQSIPPILLMEMALKQTSNFGYKPNDLLRFLTQRALYNFYAVNEFNGKLKKIVEFAADDIGANVFCIPTGHYLDRTEKFLKNVTE